MGIESSKINVIYNGSPDYSEFKKQQSNLSFSEVWSKSEFSGASKKAAFEALVNHQLNFLYYGDSLRKIRFPIEKLFSYQPKTDHIKVLTSYSC